MCVGMGTWPPLPCQCQLQLHSAAVDEKSMAQLDPGAWVPELPLEPFVTSGWQRCDGSSVARGHPGTPSSNVGRPRGLLGSCPPTPAQACPCPLCPHTCAMPTGPGSAQLCSGQPHAGVSGPSARRGLGVPLAVSPVPRLPRCPPLHSPYISGHVAGTAASRRAVTAGTQIPSDSPFPLGCSRLAPGPGVRGRTPCDPAVPGLQGLGGMGTRPPCPCGTSCRALAPAAVLPAPLPGRCWASVPRRPRTRQGWAPRLCLLRGSVPWGWARGSLEAGGHPGGSAGGSGWPPCTSGSDLAHSTGLSTWRRLGLGVQRRGQRLLRGLAAHGRPGCPTLFW